MTATFDPTRILECLHRHHVEFVLIGGVAAVAHGSPLATFDVDITPTRSHDNLTRLARALRELGAQLRTEGDPIVFPIEAEFLAAQPHMLNLTTDAGDLDINYTPADFPDGFTQLRENALEVALVDDHSTFVASLRDVIRSKEAAGRAKDRAALPFLYALRDRLGGSE